MHRKEEMEMDQRRMSGKMEKGKKGLVMCETSCWPVCFSGKALGLIASVQPILLLNSIFPRYFPMWMCLINSELHNRLARGWARDQGASTCMQRPRVEGARGSSGQWLERRVSCQTGPFVCVCGNSTAEAAAELGERTVSLIVEGLGVW